MDVYAPFVEPGQFCRLILANGERSKNVFLRLDEWPYVRFANIRTGEAITLPDDALVQEVSLNDVAQFLLFGL